MNSITDSPEIPYGFCHCGCGERTTIAPRNWADRGWIKGRPARYRSGHNAKRNYTSAEARFWANVDRPPDPDACWGWLAACDSWGYGRLMIEGRRDKAHRYSYELHHGSIPEGYRVLHTCDNPPCANPRHLFTGTNADNTADMVAKGRQRRGEMKPGAKLTDEQVREMRRLYAAGGVMQKELARLYGIGQTTVLYILRGETWKHVK